MRKHFASNGFVALTIIAGVLFLVACSTTPTPGSSNTPASQVTPAGTPTPTKPIGELKVGIPGSTFFNLVSEPAATGNSGFFATTTVLVFDQLIMLNPEGQVSPGLAERWELAPDGTSQTFYIRKGVKFHDGSDLTGADVKFSIERFNAPESTNALSPELRGQIAGVDLKDDYTVVVRLKTPLFEVLPAFTYYAGGGSIVPKKYIEEKGTEYFRKNPIGSGPWKLVKQEAGSRIELEANENYWRTVPQFKNLTLLNVPEEATKVSMLKTGELDIAQVSPDSVAGLKSAGVRVIYHEGGDLFWADKYYDVDNPSKYAMGDVRVRKALSLSVNRQEMADKIYGGNARPAVVPQVPTFAYFWDSSVLKADPFDPDQAKKLLADAGRSNGFTAKIWDTGGGGLLSTLDQAIGGYWSKIGVNVSVVPIEFASLTTKIRPKQQPDIWDTENGFLSGGGYFGFEKMPVMYHSIKSGPKNIKNPKLDELIDKVPMTADLAEKKKLALQAVLLVKEDYGAPAYVESFAPFALSSKIGNITMTKGMSYLGPTLATATRAK